MLKRDEFSWIKEITRLLSESKKNFDFLSLKNSLVEKKKFLPGNRERNYILKEM